MGGSVCPLEMPLRSISWTSSVAVPSGSSAVTRVASTPRRSKVTAWTWPESPARAPVKTSCRRYVCWSSTRYLTASVAAWAAETPGAQAARASPGSTARKRMAAGGMLLSMALRVCSWNLQLGLRLDLILEGLELLGGPDLVALQESSVSDGVEDAARVASCLGPDYEWWQVTAQRLRGREQANAVVWNRRRFAITGREALALPAPAGRILRRIGSRRNALMLEG